jgi:molybdate transport system regulatory protein
MGSKHTGKEAFVSPRLRIMRGREIALGPGRVELLELIERTGNLRAAAKAMGVSYMRAWNLLRYTNRCFAEPLVVAVRGGKSGGGAELTKTGKRVVAIYREMEKRSAAAMREPWAKLRKQLRK